MITTPVIKRNEDIWDLIKRSKVSVSQIANKMNTSESTIRKVFKLELCESKKQYFRKLIKSIAIENDIVCLSNLASVDGTVK